MEDKNRRSKEISSSLKTNIIKQNNNKSNNEKDTNNKNENKNENNNNGKKLEFRYYLLGDKEFEVQIGREKSVSQKIIDYVYDNYICEEVKQSLRRSFLRYNSRNIVQKCNVEALETTICALAKEKRGFIKLLRESFISGVVELTVEILYIYALNTYECDNRMPSNAVSFSLLDLVQVLLMHKLRQRVYEKLACALLVFSRDSKLPFFSKYKGYQMEFVLFPSLRAKLPSPLPFLSYSSSPWAVKNSKLVSLVRKLKPSNEVVNSLTNAYVQINACLKKLFGVGGLLFGSAANGFCLKSSDLDILVLIPPEEYANLLIDAKQTKSKGGDDISQYTTKDTKREREGRKTENRGNGEEEREKEETADPWGFLEHSEAAAIWAGRKLAEFCTKEKAWKTLCVEKASVPIVHIYYPLNDNINAKNNNCNNRNYNDGKDEDTQKYLEVDISFNHVVALHNTRLFAAYAAFDERAQQLALLVKHWAKQRDICDSYRGTLSGYAWLNLVVFFLQRYFVVKEEENENYSRLYDDSSKFMEGNSRDMRPFSEMVTGHVYYPLIQGTYRSVPYIFKALCDENVMPVLPNLQNPPYEIEPTHPSERNLFIDKNKNVYFYHPLHGVNKPLGFSNSNSNSSSTSSVYNSNNSIYNDTIPATDSSSSSNSCNSRKKNNSDTKYTPWIEETFEEDPAGYANYQLNCTHALDDMRKRFSSSDRQKLLKHTKPDMNKILKYTKGSEHSTVRCLLSSIVYTTDDSLIAMFYAFFRFYCAQFNVYRDVIDIKCAPNHPALKAEYFVGHSEDDHSRLSYLKETNGGGEKEKLSNKKNKREELKKHLSKGLIEGDDDIIKEGEGGSISIDEVNKLLKDISLDGNGGGNDNHNNNNNLLKTEGINNINSNNNDLNNTSSFCEEEEEEEVGSKDTRSKVTNNTEEEKAMEEEEERKQEKEERECEEEMTKYTEEDAYEEKEENGICEMDDEEFGKSVDWLRKRAFLSIIDPFEIKRVLGSYRHGQEYIAREMLRAMALLSENRPDSIYFLFKKQDLGDGRRWKRLRNKDEAVYKHPRSISLSTCERSEIKERKIAYAQLTTK